MLHQTAANNPSISYLTRCQPSAVELWLLLEPSSDVILHGRKELKEPRGTHFVQTKLFTLRDLLRFTTAEVQGCGRQITAELQQGCPKASTLRCSHASTQEQIDDNVYNDTDLSQHSHTHTFKLMAYAQTQNTTKCIRTLLTECCYVFTFLCSYICIMPLITAHLPSLTHDLLEPM